MMWFAVIRGGAVALAPEARPPPLSAAPRWSSLPPAPAADLAEESAVLSPALHPVSERAVASRSPASA